VGKKGVEMPIAEADVMWVDEPRLGLWEQLYIPAMIDGLKTTVSHLFSKKVTEQYPEQEPKLPANYRGVHRLNRDEDGRVKCVACYMCATACPAHCIDIVAAEAPPEWKDREKYPETFVIDELRCIYCGMCEEACPVDAIELTTLYDLTGLSREEMIFDKEKLLSVFDTTTAAGTDPVRTHPGKLSVASETPSLV
jgi:NADH-quinone oxidoreductase subunit I